MANRSAFYSSAGPNANHVEFNSSKQYFCVALEDGFSLHSSETSELHSREEMDGSIGFATMMGTSQMMGLLSGGENPRHDRHRLILYDTTKHAEVATIKTAQPLIRIQLSLKHIAAVHDRGVLLYRHQPKIEKIASYETTANPLGLCSLGDRTVVFPGRSPGQLQIVNLLNLDISIVPAHSSPLRAIELSPDEELVASASDKGTIIRLHSTLTNARILELRRGVTSATIFSLAISPNNNFLAVTSDTKTLHVFDLLASPAPKPDSSSRSPTPERNMAPQEAKLNKWGGLSKVPFAPRVFTDTYSFASIAFDPGAESEDTAEDGFVDIVSGVPGGTPTKGVAGWISENTIVVINAGRDARYERFVLVNDRRGKTVCVREGWAKFLVPS